MSADTYQSYEIVSIVIIPGDWEVAYRDEDDDGSLIWEDVVAWANVRTITRYRETGKVSTEPYDGPRYSVEPLVLGRDGSDEGLGSLDLACNSENYEGVRPKTRPTRSP